METVEYNLLQFELQHWLLNQMVSYDLIC